MLGMENRKTDTISSFMVLTTLTVSWLAEVNQ